MGPTTSNADFGASVLRLLVLTLGRSKSRKDTSVGIDIGALPTREFDGEDVENGLNTRESNAGARNVGRVAFWSDCLINWRSGRWALLQDMASLAV